MRSQQRHAATEAHRPATARKPRPLVVVVDDEREVCDAIAMTLKSTGFRAAAYTDPSAFLAEVSRLDAACILLDVRMPRVSGLEVQQALAARGIEIPVVFVSGHGDIPMAVAAVRAGALQFLEKPFLERTLVGAAREAVAEAHRRRAARAATEALRTRVLAMSPRERQVAEAVATGKSAESIGRLLHLSRRTIEMHKLRAMRRLGVGTSTEMTRLIVEARAAGILAER
jgi:FixJ family two-component response regulator